MGYVIAVVVLLLIVALGVTLLRVSARRHGRAGSQAAADETHGAGVPGSDMAIVAEDRSSPLGDTSEHSGRQQEGETVSDQDADRSGGSGRPAGGGYAGTSGIGAPTEGRRTDDANVARPLVGGEGEGLRRTPADDSDS